MSVLSMTLRNPSSSCIYRYKDAIKECNQGLAIEGSNAKVLFRRARARFEVGLYKDALSDVAKVNASTEKNEESVTFEKKVRDVLAGHKPEVSGPVVANPNQKQPPTKEQTQQMLRQAGHQFVCKVTLEGETKVLHLPYGITYYGLQLAIKEKWTGLHNFKIFYHDRDSDWVLVTCAKDVVKAQHEVLTYAQRHMAYRQRQGLDTQVLLLESYLHALLAWSSDCVLLQKSEVLLSGLR